MAHFGFARSKLVRYSSFAAVWVVLIAVGRAVRPSESGAAQVRPEAVATRASISPGIVVGTLAGKSYRVTLLTTPEGTRYDVSSTDGAPIARMLDAKALAATFPDIDVRSLTASPEGTQVMTVEGHRGEH